MNKISSDDVLVIAPNIKRRLSGVTATVARLVPLQSQKIAIATAGPPISPIIPRLSFWQIIFMSREGPEGNGRVWHARRNIEMLVGLILKLGLRKKLHIVFTSASQRHHSRYTKALIAQMDYLVATSRQSATYLDRDAHVIMHGIDTEEFHPAESRHKLRQELGLPDVPLIGCFGRIRHQKGTDVFVDAMINVLSAQPDAQAVVLGRVTSKHRAFKDELEARIDKANLNQRLLFLPEVSTKEIAKWYAALDVFVAPQRWEGFGLTPLEALASGVPVVATQAGAFEELVDDGRTGFLVPCDDVNAIVNSVLKYLNNQKLLSQHAANARNSSLTRHGIEREANTLVEVYAKLLAH